jgi:hypothetical protein
MIAGFNPMAAWGGKFPARKKDEGSQSKVWGLVTAQYKLFSIFAYPGLASKTTWRIAGIKPVETASKYKLSHLMDT